MEKKRFLILLLTINLCFPILSSAETIVLKSGQTIEGKIIEKTDKYIKIDFEGVPLTYFMDEIDKVEGGNPFSANEEKKKGALIVVGDANLTYASYFFTLPSGWMSALNQQLMQYTHEIGYWRGMRVDDEIAIVIVPDKKERGETVEDFIRSSKERNVKEEGCSSNSMIEHTEFNLVLKYPYKVYKWNCPKGTYGLSVFLDLPTHVIFFNLSGRGRDENCLLPYFDDFRKMLTSFRWLLGLSDEEIGNMLKKIQ